MASMYKHVYERCQFFKIKQASLISILKISKGLDYLHRKSIVHLDLKVGLDKKIFCYIFEPNVRQPENIVLTEKDGQTVKIIDFGTAMQLRKGEKVKEIKLSKRPLLNVRTFFLFQGSSNGWNGRICCSRGLFFFNKKLSSRYHESKSPKNV